MTTGEITAVEAKKVKEAGAEEAGHTWHRFVCVVCCGV